MAKLAGCQPNLMADQSSIEINKDNFQSLPCKTHITPPLTDNDLSISPKMIFANLLKHNTGLNNSSEVEPIPIKEPKFINGIA